MKIEDQKRWEIVKDPVEYIKVDLKIQEEGVEFLYNCISELKDPITYEILKAYLADEEEDLYLSQDRDDRDDWLPKLAR